MKGINEMDIKPEGLALPDCQCFKDKLAVKVRNGLLDKVSAVITINASDSFHGLEFCDKSRDYFYSALIFQLLISCCPKYGAFLRNSKGKIGRLENHREEFEAAYERLKPMVMQRIEYLDGMADKVGLE
jgi:hypothetical protein